MRFVQLEPHLTRHSGDSGLVMACVAASMHPKLLYKDAGNVWKTLTNNAPVAIHPSSSNFSHGRKADFGNASFLTYFNIQQSKKLYVWENGVVDEKAVLLLCGDVDVKVSSEPTNTSNPQLKKLMMRVHPLPALRSLRFLGPQNPSAPRKKVRSGCRSSEKSLQSDLALQARRAFASLDRQRSQMVPHAGAGTIIN